MNIATSEMIVVRRQARHLSPLVGFRVRGRPSLSPGARRPLPAGGGTLNEKIADAEFSQIRASTG